MINHETQSGSETPNNPNIRIVFFGYPHADMNLQGARRLAASFRSHLTEITGPAYIFHEAADETTEEVNKHNRILNKVGLAPIAFASGSNRRDITQNQVKRTLETIRRVGFKKTIDRNLLPIEEIRSVYTGIELDNCKSVRPFTYKSESHGPNERKELKDLLTSFEIQAAKRDKSLASHDFDSAAESEGMAQKFLYLEECVRHKDICADIQQLVKPMTLTGGLVFLPFGTAHEFITNDLSDTFREIAPHMVTEISYRSSWQQSLIDQAKTNKQPQFTEEELARFMTERIARNFLRDTVISRKLAVQYAPIYENVDHQLLDQISDLSLPTLRNYLAGQNRVKNSFQQFLSQLVESIKTQRNFTDLT